MSFTSDIKNEISNNNYSKDEMIAELSAIINISGILENNEIKRIYSETEKETKVYKELNYLL